MSSKAQREEFKQYKEDVEKRGKAFFPHAMFHDTVMSLIVVLVIFGLACVWYFTARDGDSGWIGPLYTDQADPGTTSFVPRPDWYFFFLFYLLRIFKWPDSVILGTIGIPTICIILLLALPFMDRRMERRLSRRPVAIVAAILVVVSMGVLTYKGATAREASSATGEQLLAGNNIADRRPRRHRRRRPLRHRRLPELPHVRQPGSARTRSEPVRDRRRRTRRGVLGRVDPRPTGGQTRDDHARLPEPDRRAAAAAGRLPRGVEARRLAGRPCASSWGSRAHRALRMPHACFRRSPAPGARSASRASARRDPGPRDRALRRSASSIATRCSAGSSATRRA